MNDQDTLARLHSAEIQHERATPGSPDWEAARAQLSSVDRDIRLTIATNVGREAAITAGHRALARLVTTR